MGGIESRQRAATGDVQASTGPGRSRQSALPPGREAADFAAETGAGSRPWRGDGAALAVWCRAGARPGRRTKLNLVPGRRTKLNLVRAMLPWRRAPSLRRVAREAAGAAGY
jgi:hypothetical protein